MFIIYPDCQLTRRKRLHIIVDRHNEVRFTAADLTVCMAWIREQGVQVVAVVSDIEGNLAELNLYPSK